MSDWPIPKDVNKTPDSVDIPTSNVNKSPQSELEALLINLVDSAKAEERGGVADTSVGLTVAALEHWKNQAVIEELQYLLDNYRA